VLGRGCRLAFQSARAVPEPLGVVIAEDNYLVREGTRRLLEDSRRVTVLATVGNATELLDAVGRLRPDVVITDIKMPPGHQMEGIEAALEIRARHPGVGVVVLSQHADDVYAYRLLKDGTGGLAYLLKERVGDLGAIIEALEAVARGGSVVDPKVVEALVSRRTREAESPLARLTPRELAVLREMAQGKSNQAIGEALFMSESAVEKHVTTIFSKLELSEETQVNRRVAAVLTFLREATLNP
jgi:DNA-binding NarL/FixJ family response regulator